jgi:hypothetical protein
MAIRLTGINSAEYIKVSDTSSSVEGRTIIIQAQLVGLIDKEVIFAVPNPGAPCGLVSIEASQGNGLVRYTWSFRAPPDENKKDSSNATERPQEMKEINGSIRSEPIGMHKDFASIYEKYGKAMRGGVVEWLDGNPDAASDSGLSTQSSSSVNPMAGIRNYSKGGAVFSETKFYASRRAVPNVLSGVGYVSNPSGVDGDASEWLLMGATITSMGSGYRVDKKWMRDERGWLEELYPPESGS